MLVSCIKQLPFEESKDPYLLDMLKLSLRTPGGALLSSPHPAGAKALWFVLKSDPISAGVIRTDFYPMSCLVRGLGGTSKCSSKCPEPYGNRTASIPQQSSNTVLRFGVSVNVLNGIQN